jgi:hypothetical protein
MSDRNAGSIGAFPAVLKARISADARIARAVAFCWFAAGLASFAVLAGAGIALALYGYSFVVSPAAATGMLAKAFVKAISESKMSTVVRGTMELPPTAELTIAKGQTVALAEGSAVKISPDSSIRVVGDFKFDVPQPSKQQLQIDATSRSKEIPFTRYTVFKQVKFNTGNVVTGWSFELSDPLSPTFQHCYYEEMLANNVSASQTIGVNGLPRRPSALSKLTFDFDGALANCFWFSG